MRSLRYLNVMLTVISVLLTLHLWTLWTGGPQGGPAVELVATAQAQGIPNAGAQRKEIADQLKLLNVKTDQMLNLFKNGQARIRIEGGGNANGEE